MKAVKNRGKNAEKTHDEPKKYLVVGGTECSGAAGTENVAIVKAKSKSQAESKAKENCSYGMRGNRAKAYLIDDLNDGWQLFY